MYSTKKKNTICNEKIKHFFLIYLHRFTDTTQIVISDKILDN